MACILKMMQNCFDLFYYKEVVLFIFLCNINKPYNNASAVGGQPGTYTSTGTILSHPLTTEYE